MGVYMETDDDLLMSEYVSEILNGRPFRQDTIPADLHKTKPLST